MDTKKIGKGNSFLHVAISGDQPIDQDGIESMNRRVRSLAHEVPLVTGSRDGCLKECSGRWKLNEIDGNGTFPHKNRCVLSFQEITSNILKFTGSSTLPQS